MKQLNFTDAKYVKSAVKPKDYPKSQLPEIAIVGRSNVGKSTLLNHFFQRKGLVKTSSTPGKTRLINFFSLDDALMFVDLPGYGYAKKPDGSWSEMIESYLNERENLRMLLFLVDIRRKPSEEDLKMFAWLTHRQLPAILVLTKVDKVKRGERAKQTKLILGMFEEKLPFVHYSATKNEGRKELIHQLAQLL